LVTNDIFDNLINEAVLFVLSKQNNDGSWNYSYDIKNNTERKQIDFHQGFILTSLNNIYSNTNFCTMNCMML